MSDFYGTIDVAVVPSLEEPLGRIPLEAAAHGRPSIAFATGGLVQTIAHGQTGWLVPTGDVRGLHDAIAGRIRAPSEPREAGVRAKQRVLVTCNPGQYIVEIARLYRELVAAARRGSPPAAGAR